MAQRKLDTLTFGAHAARIYRDAVADEFVVKFDRNGAPMGPTCDYNTGDRADAFGTALHELRRMSGVDLLGIDLEVQQGGQVRLIYIERDTETRFYAAAQGTDFKAMANHLRAVAKLASQDAKRAREADDFNLVDISSERARRASLAAALLESKQ